MTGAEPFAVELLVAAFAGGAFGAAVGPLPAFTFTGFVVIVGEVYKIAQKTIVPGASVDPATVGSVPITESIAFGVVLGPHVAFGGGAAAVAYASKKGYLDSDFEYHQAKEVTRGLGARADVLLVGGVFGVLGYGLTTAAASIGAPWDPVAMGVVLSALLHRAAFGYSIVGGPAGRAASRFDMSPFERGERRTAARGAATDGGQPANAGRYAVEPWLPYQFRWSGVAVLGIVVGILGAYVAYLTTSPFLAFGLSVGFLVFVNAGVDEVPVTHHITLPASTAVLAAVPTPVAELTPASLARALPLWEALVLGAGFGLLGALAGEVLQRVLYAHAETHLDPPAASIVVSTFAIAVLAIVGVFPHAVWIPTP
jgi:hypothetical protein